MRSALLKTPLKAATWGLIAARRSRRTPTRRVAIVVPTSARSEFLPDELISLRHLVHFLGHYDKYLVAPQGLNVRAEGFTTYEFSRKYFGSMLAYNRLMYAPALYEKFLDYQYILIYHLDALVFRDELMAWCDRDVDYVGAPWLPGPDTPWCKEPAVGNGGFALMKTAVILEVLYRRYQANPLMYWRDVLARELGRHSAVLADPSTKGKWLGSGRLACKLWDQVRATETNVVYNDIFWGYHAHRYLPEFKIPDWKTALQFAFEGLPRKCFELTEGKLPFGCHAWGKFDRKFWEPFLLSDNTGAVANRDTQGKPRPAAVAGVSA